MPSGVFYGTTTNKYISCALTWNATSDAANNRSYVTVTLSLKKSSVSTAATHGTGYFRLSFLGTQYTWNAGHVDIPRNNSWSAKKVWDFGYVNHGTDGALSIPMSLVNTGNYSGLPGTTYTHSYVSGTAVLETFTTGGGGGTTPPADPDPAAVGVTITSEHTAIVTTGLLTKARYSLTYVDLASRAAHVHIHHTATPETAIYAGDVLPDTDISLAHAIAAGDLITMVVTTTHPIVANSQSTDFYEAVVDEDNTWTYLGYADDQLVGMTANNQIWNGALTENGSPHYELANAQLVPDPTTALVYADAVAVVPATGGITISATATEAEPFRITISYTMLTRFGPTLPAPALTFYASKPTTEWTTAKFVQLDGVVANIVDGVSAGIVAVELYYTEGEYQQPAFLGRVNLPDITAVAPETPPTTKPWVFNWTGYQTDTSMWTVANLTPPVANYSTGVPASKMAVLDGQLYFWGNTAHPYRIYIGGNPGNRFSVSPGTGGGFVDVEPGVGTEVRNVLKFKTQQGAAIVTALCDNANSQREARFNLVESTIAISDEQSVKGWMAEKIAGTVGCKSGNGAVVAGDGLYAVSRYGLAITTLTMEYNSQLQVMYVSDPISPVFLKQLGHQLDASVLFAVNGVLYMTFGTEDASLDNVIFCYDIALKAFWTYTLDVEDPILNMIHIDHDGSREGIGIITANSVFLLPTTVDEAFLVPATHNILIESGELTTMQPLQSMHHLSQLEFRFDYFIGDLDVMVVMIDQFGRTTRTTKTLSYPILQHQLAEYIRIDQVVESYKIILSGQAKMRLTHFIAKLYPKSNRIGMVYGFDSRQSHATPGSIHRTFSSYNDLRDAIIP
jgi:hypothetical protein